VGGRRSVTVSRDKAELARVVRSAAKPRGHALLLDEPAELASALAAGSAAQQMSLLRRASAELRAGERVSDERLQAALWRLVDVEDPQLADAAVYLCARLRVPGALHHFREIVAAGGGTATMLVALASEEPYPELVALALARYRIEIEEGRRRLVDVLYWLAQRPEPELRDPALRGLSRVVEVATDPRAIEIVAWHGDERFAAAVEQAVRRGLSRPLALTCLAALAKWRGPTAAPGVYPFLDDPELRGKASELLGEGLAGKAHDETVRRIARMVESSSEARDKERGIVAISEIGGAFALAEATRLVEAQLPRLEPELAWVQVGLTVRHALRRLFECGFLTGAEEELALRQELARDRVSMRGPRDLLDALARAGRVFTFDPSGAGTPPDYSAVLQRFAAITGGRLRFEACLVEAAPGDRRGWNVELVMNGALYRVHALDQSDWYDEEAIELLLGGALHDAADPGTFRSIGMEDMIFCDDGTSEVLGSELRMTIA
jgi:hypothetical protein